MSLIQHIADTARWVATYRADETDREDAVFSDPLARRLAGDRGAAIAAAVPFAGENSWSFVARTWLFDKYIREQIEQGAEVVVNLAAGLDTRPYRMNLPASLRWVEVDLPEILDYKEGLLEDETPVCRLERVRLDLSHGEARRKLFQTLRAPRSLVLTEGLIVYLSSDEAAGLATDLSVFSHWAMDLVSPGLLKMFGQQLNAQFAEGVSTMQFAPLNGPAFFVAQGWTVQHMGTMLLTALDLNRLPPHLLEFSKIPVDPVHAPDIPWSGVCLVSR